MSARLACSAFQAAARRASTIPNVVRTTGRRNMSSAAQGEKPNSDMRWMIGSATIFGPAFLYLISPSARKNTPAVHNDKHNYPTLKTDDHDHHHPVKAPTQKAPAPVAQVVMKDDEGTEANVSSSVALAEESNVPNSSVSPEAHEQTKVDAESEDAPPPAPAPAADSVEKSTTEEEASAVQEAAEDAPAAASGVQEEAS